MTDRDLTQTDVNNPATDASIDAPLTQAGSPVVRKFADRSMTGWGFTYFVRRDDTIKIGHSAVPKRRLSNIQQGFPDKLEVLAVIPNTIIDEPTAHKKFHHLRIHGEWFRSAPDLLTFIEWAKAEAEEIPKRTYPKPKPKRDRRSKRQIELAAMMAAYENAEPDRKETLGLMLRRNYASVPVSA